VRHRATRLDRLVPDTGRLSQQAIKGG